MAGHRRSTDTAGTRANGDVNLGAAGLTETESRGLLRFLLIAVAVGADIAQGSGYVFGAPATAPSLLLMARASVPVSWWGAVLVLAGLLLILRRPMLLLVGFALGALTHLLWAGFAFAVLLPVIPEKATGWGWPWPLTFAVIHGVGVWFAGRVARRTVRSGGVSGDSHGEA